MAFWNELWSDYRELAKSLVGTILELVAVILLIKSGSIFIGYFDIHPSCSRSELIECAHTLVLIFAWAGLVGSFVVVATIFVYRHTIRRMREMHTAEELKQAKNYNLAIVDGVTSMSTTAGDSDRLRSIETLMVQRDLHPLDRKVNLFLGRLYKLRKDYVGAIDATTRFLERKTAAKETTDVDYADLLFNRACYRFLQAAKVGPTTPEGQQMKTKAYKDLAESINLAPSNKGDAATDPDFQQFRGEKEFQDLLA